MRKQGKGYYLEKQGEYMREYGEMWWISEKKGNYMREHGEYLKKTR